jgi:hypothetical protein
MKSFPFIWRAFLIYDTSVPKNPNIFFITFEIQNVTIMKKLLALLALFLFTAVTAAQDKVDPDFEIKDMLYNKYKSEVRAYDRKHFDDLFMEFFEKQATEAPTLTKEEYYTYTIKIAIYSEKYGMLYKKEKDGAQKTKNEWFARMYSDYLASRPKTD